MVPYALSLLTDLPFLCVGENKADGENIDANPPRFLFGESISSAGDIIAVPSLT